MSEIPESEFRMMRHDLRDHLQALSFGIQILQESVTDPSQQALVLETLEKMSKILREISQHKFMKIELRAR